ncbi:34793_t:CDS:2, partial [Gigaspora margarita]
RLENAAQLQSNYIASCNVLTHDSIYGDLGTRIKAYGYSYSSCAENVGVGYNNEAMAMDEISKTPSKHAQSRYAHFAAGLSRGFWVQVLE